MSLDQFYTTGPIAERCYALMCEHLDPEQFLMVEPSAGTGSFFKLLPQGSVGVDLDLKCPGVIKADFLTLSIESSCPIAVIGNPPFGRRASLAIQFVNHAASFANVIGFILPRTFKKDWIDNRLDRRLHLVREEPIPDEAFIFEGRLCSVPAVFQIWERRDNPRDRPRRIATHRDFEFLKTSTGADFVIRRIGVRAGRLSSNVDASPSSFYFIRSNVRNRRNVRAIMGQLDFSSAAANVAGTPSLSKPEIVALYANFVAREDGSGVPPSYCCSPVSNGLRAMCER